MKCPKCGYISFDYNQLCPRCNKNISAELEKFNLPAFRPDPPALLGFLIGEANESNVNLRVPSGSHIRGSADGMGLSDSVVLDQDTVDVDDHDLDVSFPPGEESEEDLFEQEFQVESEKSLSDADFHLEEKAGDEDVIQSEEDLSLDLGDLSLEEPEEALDKLAEEENAQGISSDDAFLKSTESLPSDIVPDEIESEIELDLDDLKVSDMGDLEIGADMASSLMEMESTFVESEEVPEQELEMSEEDQLPDISELILEEAKAGTNEKIMIADDLSPEEAGAAQKEGELVLDEIELEDFDLGEEDLLGAEEEKSVDAEKTILLEDLDINDSGELEKSFDISDISLDEDYAENMSEEGPQESLADTEGLGEELEAMSLDVDDYQKKSELDDDIDLDLDDMDIDLDLGETKK